MTDCRAELAEQLDEARWSWLEPHYRRGAVIVVDEMLELPMAGERIAADDMASVKAWLASGLLQKPTDELVEIWRQQSDKKFMMLVVAPFILIQTLSQE